MEPNNQKLNKKNIFYWSLYDFANSVAVVAFFLYFSQWLVVENHIADIWYNLIFTGSSLLLILTSPVLGRIADRRRQRMPYLRLMTVLLFVCLLAVSFLALFAPNSARFAFLAAGAYMLANYFYQFSFSFYNPLLDEIAPEDKQGLVSGIGQAANWLGAIAGILISLLFLGGTVYWFGRAGRAQTFLPATVIFFILTLPTLLWLKDKHPLPGLAIKIKDEYKNFFCSFLRLCRTPGIGRYLLAFFFFNDAILTAENNYPIYMQRVFGVSDKIKSLLLLGILVTSVIGAFFSGYLADKIGHKKMLVVILIGWAIILPLLAGIKFFPLFAVLTVVMGLLYGATWSVTRLVMLDLTPKDQLNYAFSFYTLGERFSTFVGPLLWGMLIFWLADKGALRYQVAMFSMVIFIIIGLVLVKKIPAEKNRQILPS